MLCYKVENEKIPVKDLEPDGEISEVLAALRTKLHHERRIRVIQVTSTLPKEGKTMVALQLARSFAKMGRHTLAVDGDLRKNSREPFVLSGFSDWGLNRFLEGHREEVLFHTDMENLDVVQSGGALSNPTEILCTGVFEDFLTLARQQYEYVIIDSPSVGTVMDGVIMARHADGVLMVVREDFVKKNAARGAGELLTQNGCPVVGIVMNRVSKSRKGANEPVIL